MARTNQSDPETDVDAEAAPRRRKRLPILVGVAVVLALAGGGVVFLGGTGDAIEGPEPVEEGPVVEVAAMTLNLAGPKVGYARVTFAAVLAADAKEDDVVPLFPLLKDAAISEVGTFDGDFLRTPEGVDHLRKRLSERAAEVFPDGAVLRIVLTELVVQ